MCPIFYPLGLVGYPVEHSLSPLLFKAALQACGLDGEYRLYPFPASDEGVSNLMELLAKLRRGGIHGLNVTIPHKQRVISYLDDLTPIARSVGAVNTVFGERNGLTGDNTDVPGFLADLSSHMEVEGHNRSALVLGAGGAARAVVFALCQAGWQVWIVARRPEQAEELVLSFSGDGHLPRVAQLTEESMIEVLSRWQITLIVNTSPLGTLAMKYTSPWPSKLPFPRNAFVYDLVYNPSETLLMQQARAAGLQAANGLGMLLVQAALSFERWTGIKPPVDVMLNALNGKVL